MMKKYFTDGLIQIAIVLSLLRTDLNLNNLNSYYNTYPDIQEIILGSSSAYTQTHFHSQNWVNDGTNGYAHPKSIDNYYANSIFSELHSLSRFRRMGQRDNDINAWLVIGPSSLALPSESASDSAPPTSQNPSQNSNIQVPSNAVQDQSEPEGAIGQLNNNVPDLGLDLTSGNPGSELTKEDMDLIDILWRQDMDLGVGREMYDQNMRRELEKEKELELLKEREKEQMEKELLAKAEETQLAQELEQNINFIIDGETGEVIPVPIQNSDVTNDAQTQQTVDALQVLEEIQQDQYLQQQQQPQQQFLQPEQPLPEVSAPQQPQSQYLPDAKTEVPPQPEIDTANLQDEIEAIIASAAQSFPEAEQEQVEQHDSIERQWQEVAELLGEQELALDLDSLQAEANTNIVNPTVPVNSANALLQNATLTAPVNTTAGFNHTIAELCGEAPANFSMGPSASLTNQTFDPYPAPTGTNDTLHNPNYGSLFDLDTQDLMFSNLTEAVSTDRNSTLNHTENLLQELMDTDLSNIHFNPIDPALMQTLQDSLKTEDVSSDSAVSSMSSPTHMQDVNETASMFSDQASTYDGLQGATGGSDYDTASESGKVTKHLPTYNPDYGHDFGYRMSDNGMMNHSSASNDSDSHYSPADISQVQHNHTYPMIPASNQASNDHQPQPQPRRASASQGSSSSSSGSSTGRGRSNSRKSVLDIYDSKIASARDARKARQLKIPFSMDTIIHSAVDEFNELLAKHDLSEIQLQLIRDIRRRGKNKVAAQNCRKRKLDVITTLEQEVMRMRQQKEDLLRKRQSMARERGNMKDKLDVMYREVFSSLRDENGQPYDPRRYLLTHAEDGSVLLVPRNASTSNDHEEKAPKKKKSSKKN